MNTEYVFKTITLEDFDRICRICLGDQNLYPIADTTIEDLKVSDLLNKCLTVQVSQDDSMPQIVCENCLSALYRLYQFKEQYHENEIYLKSLLQNVKEETVEQEELKPLLQIAEDDCKIKEDLDKKRRRKLAVAKTWGRKIQCEICQKIIKAVRRKIHMRSHTNERPYQCEICLQKFLVKFHLTRHKRAHFDDRRYVCAKCGARFLRPDALHSHENRHMEADEAMLDATYNCKQCGRFFRRATAYQKHLETHTGAVKKEEMKAREHMCHVCQRRFVSKFALNQHLVLHGEKSFLCSVCGKGFARRAGLTAHSAVHTDEKSLSCPVCYKLFKRSSSLNVHMVIHSGMTPFACKLCPKSFTQSSHLSRHLKIHTGEKPFLCPHCDKRFSQKCNLVGHVRTHTGEKPFVCPVCGKDFTEISAMKKHRRIHNKQKATTLREKEIESEASISTQSNLNFAPFESVTAPCETVKLEFLALGTDEKSNEM